MLFADNESDDGESDTDDAVSEEGDDGPPASGRGGEAGSFCTLATCLRNSRRLHMMPQEPSPEPQEDGDPTGGSNSEEEIDPPELVPIESSDAAGHDESDSDSDSEQPSESGEGDDSEAEARSVEADRDEELSADLLARVRAAAEGLGGSDSDDGDGLDSDDEDGCA